MNKLSKNFVAIIISITAVFSGTQVSAKNNDNNEHVISQSVYGFLPNGEMVSEYTLRNMQGMQLSVISYGGIITSLTTPDKNGKFTDVVLGYDNLQDYLDGTTFFGALIGRYGNRIAKGKFTLDDKQYQLSINNGENHLHGGAMGFDKRNWQVTAFKKPGSVGLILSLLSEDGDQGYPGNLAVQVIYTLNNNNELMIDYSAFTDQPTIVNLTQHTYFNLAGRGDILNHRLQINADQYTPVDQGLIPDGRLLSVANTPFDFRQAKAIGSDIDDKDQQLSYGGGYDHNYILNKKKPGALQLAAKLTEPKSGRVLELMTTEPALQFYSGNFLNGKDSGKGQKYEFRSGLCLEPQHAPDSPNQASYPSTVLRPGQKYQSKMVYRFSTVSK